MKKQGILVTAAIGSALAGIMLMPSIGHATIIGGTEAGTCNPVPCDQTVNFAPANSGTTVVGDTNPAPVYNVFVDSLEGLTLHGSGSTVDTGVGGPGFLSILIRPEAGWAWSVIDFQLDSLISSPTPLQSGLTLTAIDQNSVPWVFNVDFPWEGNNGENQHYFAQGLSGELITSLQIDYTDPNAGEGNTIQDIHNIDVASVRVPEPSTLGLFSVGLLSLFGFGMMRRRADA